MAPLTTAKKTVGILIYPDAEVLDFCGPFEVFATTRLDEETRRESESPIHQLLVSESTEVVRASGGMRILPDVDFASCPKLDMLLVPGGHGVRALMHQPEYLDWLKQMAPQVDRLASVGTGSLLLGEAGLLVGKTRHHALSLGGFLPRALSPHFAAARAADGGGWKHHHRQQHSRRHGHGALPGGADLRTDHRPRSRAADGISISG